MIIPKIGARSWDSIPGRMVSRWCGLLRNEAGGFNFVLPLAMGVGGIATTDVIDVRGFNEFSMVWQSSVAGTDLRIVVMDYFDTTVELFELPSVGSGSTSVLGANVLWYFTPQALVTAGAQGVNLAFIKLRLRNNIAIASITRFGPMFLQS